MVLSHTVFRENGFLRLLPQCLTLAFLLGGYEDVAAQKKQALSQDLDSVTNWPEPEEPNQLFYLQRDPDENTVVYQVNLIDGKIDENKPINVFWIRYAEGGIYRQLNYVQRSLAYGVNCLRLDNGEYDVRIVSNKNIPFTLSYSERKKRYVVYAQIQGKKAILERVYVRIEGGTPLMPDVKYIELSGKDVATDKALSERIIVP